jgi:hypothetical protein
MKLQLTVAQEILQNLELRMELTGGVTESLFPKVEEWLQESSDRQYVVRTIQSFARVDDTGGYKSVVDYIFANVYPSWRKHVFRYYRGKGSQLKHQITNAERLKMQRRMLKCLEILDAIRKIRGVQASWKQVRSLAGIAA